MSKKAIFLTFVSAITVVLVVGVMSFWAARNQPTADVAVPIMPSPPAGAPANPITPNEPTSYIYPPVPKAPLLAGDSIDDGIVDVLDINVLIAHWNEASGDYNLVDDSNGQQNYIDTLDLAQTIKFWKCYELRTNKDCPYR